VPRQIEKVKEIGKRSERTFTVVHVLLPHEPYVFDANGRCLSRTEVRALTQRDGYVAQLRYANRLISELVQSLLQGSSKPIIIFQADEGPYPEAYRTTDRSWRLATPREIAMKTGILNAYYFPDGDYSALDQHITPVNTFRVIFDKYFATHYGRLPDRVYMFPDYRRLYDFFDVTAAARYGDQ
jgi:hypothetical protein